MLEWQIGRRLPNAELVQNPFNVSPVEPAPWPVETGTWCLACVARLDPAAKGQDLLLQALAQPRWRDRPVELHIYGTGRCAEGLKKMADLLELKGVFFHGHVNDVSSIWAHNHILVLPSRFEGLPLVLVESMWCGRPAIVTNIAGNTELCVDGETGFVAPAPALDILAQTLEVAWERRHEWKQMGQKARCRVEKLIAKDPVGLFYNQLLSIVRVDSLPPQASSDPNATTSPKSGQAAVIRERSQPEGAPGFGATVARQQEMLNQIGGMAVPAGIPARDRSQPCPLSPAQERLWFLEQFNPGVPVYNESAAVRLEGPLDVGAMEQALNIIVARRDILRTTIQVVGEQPTAVPLEGWRLKLGRISLRKLASGEQQAELDRLLIEEPRRPFHLETEPGIRATLIEMGPEHHVFILMTHHIICDWSSEGALLAEAFGAVSGIAERAGADVASVGDPA